MLEENAGQKPLHRERGPKSSFDLYDNPQALDVFVDGLADIILGPHVGKLNFHTVTMVAMSSEPGGRSVEIREVSVRLGLPSAQLLELAITIFKAFSDSRQTIIAQLKAADETFINALTSLPSFKEIENSLTKR